MSRESSSQHDPLSTEKASLPDSIPGYELQEEIGRGGMGVVYRAHDPPFDRDVAIKMLSENVPAESFAVTRFRTEAHITGKLQHPGIPPVHMLGTLPDNKPFLAMKLVRGQTLQKLLDKRSDAKEEPGRYVAIFEQVCQAVGYAHAHRVIHRDLKPSNIMVGAFGEVQVMDWGLAKVLGASVAEDEQEADDLSTAAYQCTSINTPDAGGSATRTGSVLGTPAYMPPEQAGGEIRKLDVRSDVFGLGAILCQILTGQPPYVGKDGNDTRIKAVRGELQEAFARLEGCAAEPDLVALCKKCLSFKQEDRPADGQVVADEVSRIRLQAETRARLAETDRAEALVREAEQRKRRRALQWAAGIIASVLLAGIAGTTIGLFHADHQRSLAEDAQKEEFAQRQLADAHRQRAQANFQRARDAVDRMLTRIGDTTLRDIPGMEKVRRKILEDALEFNKGFLQEAQQDKSVRYDAAWAFLSVADISKELDALADADQACQKARQLFEELLAETPGDRKVRSSLAQCLRLQAELQDVIGKHDSVAPLLFRASEMYEKLAAEFPDHIQYQRDLLQTYLTLYERIKTRKPDGELVLQKANSLMDKLATTDSDRGTLFVTLKAYLLAIESGNWNFEKKIDATGRVIETLNASRSKLDRGLIDDLLANLKAIRAEWLVKLKRDAEAAKEMQEALEYARKLSADFPSIPKYRDTLATVYERQGEMLATQNRFTDAEKAYQQAMTIRQELVNAQTDNIDRRVILGITQVKLGMIMVGLQLGNPGAGLQFTLNKKPAETLIRSLDCYDAAVATLQSVLQQHPQHKRAREWLSHAYQWRGANWLNWEDSLGAVDDFNKALQYAEAKDHAVLRLMRYSAESDDKLGEQITHADRLTRRGRHAEAYAIITRVIQEKLEGDATYNAACVAALCSKVVRLDPKLAPDLQLRQSTEYADGAIALLQQAIERGFRDVSHMKKDVDLQTLQNRKDFKKLVEDLEQKIRDKPATQGPKK